MTCPSCGREIPDHAIYCRYCGTQCAEAPAPASHPKKRRWLIPCLAAALLCLALAAAFLLRTPKAEPASEISTVPPAEPQVQAEVPVPEKKDWRVTIEGDASMVAGDTMTLTAKLMPEGEIERTVWTSSNEAVAQIEDGSVTAIRAGDTVIRVLITTADGPVVEDELLLTVAPAPVTYYAELENTELTLTAGKAGELRVLVSAEPEQEEIEYVVRWESSDPLVASVSDLPTPSTADSENPPAGSSVQAVGEGTATITASVSLPGGQLIRLEATVTVTPAPAAQVYVPRPKPTPPAPAPEPTPAPEPAPAPEPTPAPTPAPAPLPEGEDVITTEDYLISNSDSAYISLASLEKLSREELILARNEIYARRGRIFETDYIRQYFEAKNWYSPAVTAAEFDPAVFNKYEIANLDRIRQAEDAKRKE